LFRSDLGTFYSSQCPRNFSVLSNLNCAQSLYRHLTYFYDQKMSANGMRQFIVSSCLLLLLVTLLVQKPSSNTNGNDQGFFFVEAQSKPNNTKLYLFNEYHTASLAPNNLLYKVPIQLNNSSSSLGTIEIFIKCIAHL